MIKKDEWGKAVTFLELRYGMVFICYEPNK